MKLTESEKKLSKLILDYLRKNPNSADTLRGITEQWLRLEQIDTSTEKVERVLGHLVRKGPVGICKRGGVTFYRVSSKR